MSVKATTGLSSIYKDVSLTQRTGNPFARLWLLTGYTHAIFVFKQAPCGKSALTGDDDHAHELAPTSQICPLIPFL